MSVEAKVVTREEVVVLDSENESGTVERHDVLERITVPACAVQICTPGQDVEHKSRSAGTSGQTTPLLASPGSSLGSSQAGDMLKVSTGPSDAPVRSETGSRDLKTSTAGEPSLKKSAEGAVVKSISKDPGRDRRKRQVSLKSRSESSGDAKTPTAAKSDAQLSGVGVITLGPIVGGAPLAKEYEPYFDKNGRLLPGLSQETVVKVAQSLLLQRQWGLWMSERVKKIPGKPVDPAAESFTPPVRKTIFNNIANFWQVMNAYPPPSRLIVDINIYIFQEATPPQWEHADNKLGGRWTFSLDATEPVAADAAWQETYLALVGETLDIAENVVGVALARRRKYTRISVWTRDRADEKKNLALGRHFKALILRVAPITKLEYQDHGEAFETYRHVI